MSFEGVCGVTSRRGLLRNIFSLIVVVQARPSGSSAAAAVAFQAPPAASTVVLVDGWVLTEADVARMVDAI
jgi:hypothetical protein